MANPTNARQQLADKIKDVNTVLVTVGKSPDVDELSAALGLTIMLNKLNKHATAVVSGEIPPAIDFLNPGLTFENTVDSLRDFIIALDKEKADHLRYKVEGEVVKIFITPYRTRIDEADLEFTQGDYNVELVIAIGVKDKNDLDAALEAHGKILHDATVATVSASQSSNLGSIDWYDSSASSVSEMLVSLSESLKNDKPLLDEQSATAFLTGIVATTDRFSNDNTSSKVMTMAAQLMTAGANQQLIAEKLEEAYTIDAPEASLDDYDNQEQNADEKSEEQQSDEVASDGSLAISHEREGDLDTVARDVMRENQEKAAVKAEDALAEQLNLAGTSTQASQSTALDIQKDLANLNTQASTINDLNSVSDKTMPGFEPILGGTLNATTEQAATDKRLEEASQQNRAILSHSSSTYTSDKPAFDTPLNAAQMPDPDGVGSGLPLLPQDNPTVSGSPLTNLEPSQATLEVPESQVLPSLPPLPPIQLDASTTSEPIVDSSSPTLAEIDQQNRQLPPEHTDALADVQAVFDSPPSSESLPPVVSDFGNTQFGALPPLPDFSAPLPPPPPMGMPMDSLPQLPTSSLPPIDTSVALPAVQPAEQLGQIFGDIPGQPSQAETASVEPTSDPAQFKLPGQ